ncbi:MAG: HepT-like ribonuclease domain-containing protein [Candidatus Binatia bacterium]
MRDAIGRIDEYVADGEGQFRRDTKTQDAVIRNLEIIGEAACRPRPVTARRLFRGRISRECETD